MTDQNNETQNVDANANKQFSTQVMYSKGCGDSHAVVFDFSILPFSEYFEFFNALPNFIYKKCERISFSTDFYREYKATGRHSKRREQLITESIMYNKPKYTHYLAKIIKNVLPKSKKLASIEFRNINIDPVYIKSIFHAIGRSSSIKHVIFHGVAITDELLGEFLTSVSPYMIKSFQFTSTKMTSRCTNLVKRFINQKPKNNKVVRSISKIVLDKETFTQKQLQEIESMLIICKKERDDWEEKVQWQSDAAPITNVPYEDEKGENNNPLSGEHASQKQSDALQRRSSPSVKQSTRTPGNPNNEDKDSSLSYGSSSPEKKLGEGALQHSARQLLVNDYSTKGGESDTVSHITECSEKKGKKIKEYDYDTEYEDDPGNESQNQSKLTPKKKKDCEYTYEYDEKAEGSATPKQHKRHSPKQLQQDDSLKPPQTPKSGEMKSVTIQQASDTQETPVKTNISVTNASALDSVEMTSNELQTHEYESVYVEYDEHYSLVTATTEESEEKKE